jgi:hypothetical protein
LIARNVTAKDRFRCRANDAEAKVVAMPVVAAGVLNESPDMSNARSVTVPASVINAEERGSKPPNAQTALVLVASFLVIY